MTTPELAAADSWGFLMAVPETIRIARIPDFYTDKIGRTADGRQFMAFVVASLPEDVRRTREDWQKQKRWHAVLHKFDLQGKHLHSEIETTGTTAHGEQAAIERARSGLAEMVKTLGKVKYCDVRVSLFRVEVDGRVFGLVDASEPEENYESIWLVPNNLAFFSPWDGSYDT